jgi:DNA-binding NarL/FixJ family response regulator
VTDAIRVLVVDDQALVRGGFRLVLEAVPGIDVVGEAENGAQGVELAAQLRPHVVLMDLRMPVMDGIEATRVLRATDDGPKVLVLTTFDLDEHVYDAMRAGASGFLLKDVRPEALADAVRTVAAGDTLLAPALTRRLVETFTRLPRPGDADERLSALTARERDVLEQVARGLSNAEVARALWISEATVKSHLNRVLAKTGLRDRAQAVVLAYEAGVVTPRRS